MMAVRRNSGSSRHLACVDARTLSGRVSARRGAAALCPGSGARGAAALRAAGSGALLALALALSAFLARVAAGAAAAPPSPFRLSDLAGFALGSAARLRGDAEAAGAAAGAAADADAPLTRHWKPPVTRAPGRAILPRPPRAAISWSKQARFD